MRLKEDEAELLNTNILGELQIEELGINMGSQDSDYSGVCATSVVDQGQYFQYFSPVNQFGTSCKEEACSVGQIVTNTVDS
jgi:hypothetical protein